MTNYDKANIILQHGTIIKTEDYPTPNLFLDFKQRKCHSEIQEIMEKYSQILVQYQNKTYSVGIELANECPSYQPKNINVLFKPSCQNVGNFYELIEF